jgi:hypothetical protein
MKKCECCYQEQKSPSVVYIYLLDEDSGTSSNEVNFYFDTDGYFNSNYEYADLTRQYARYLNQVIPTISEGYLGVIFVPLRGSAYFSDHEAMKRRMKAFYNELDDKERIIILGDEEYGDPSGTTPTYDDPFATPGSIDKDTDYSDRLIAAIEKLREARDEGENDPEDDPQEEDLKPLDFIILNIDTSGSTNLEDINDTVVENLFNYYSQDIPFSEEVLSSFNQLKSDARDEYEGDGTILRYYDNFFQSGLFNGIGTRFVLWNSDEYPYLDQYRHVMYHAANRLNDNWKESCEVLCRQRWTTSGNVGGATGEGLYLIPLYGEENGPLSPYNSGIVWSDIDPNENDPDLDVYKIILEKRINGNENINFELRANYPWQGWLAPLAAIDNSRVGVGQDPYARFTESPFKETLYNIRGFNYGWPSANCPCYWYYPVNQYIKITNQQNFTDGYPYSS